MNCFDIQFPPSTQNPFLKKFGVSSTSDCTILLTGYVVQERFIRGAHHLKRELVLFVDQAVLRFSVFVHFSLTPSRTIED